MGSYLPNESRCPCGECECECRRMGKAVQVKLHRMELVEVKWSW